MFETGKVVGVGYESDYDGARRRRGGGGGGEPMLRYSLCPEISVHYKSRCVDETMRSVNVYRYVYTSSSQAVRRTHAFAAVRANDD